MNNNKSDLDLDRATLLQPYVIVLNDTKSNYQVVSTLLHQYELALSQSLNEILQMAMNMIDQLITQIFADKHSIYKIKVNFIVDITISCITFLL